MLYIYIGIIWSTSRYLNVYIITINMKNGWIRRQLTNFSYFLFYAVPFSPLRAAECLLYYILLFTPFFLYISMNLVPWSMKSKILRYYNNVILPDIYTYIIFYGIKKILRDKKRKNMNV